MRGPKPRPLADRLLSKTSRADSGCWVFGGAKNRKGYGKIYCHEQRRYTSAHRASWLVHRGEIPPGLLVCHKCDNPSCVNPDHLFVGTHRDNVQDMFSKGRGHNRAGNKQAAKLTPGQVQEIRQLAAGGVHPRKLAEMYGVCVVNIRYIIRRKTWASVP